MLGAAAIALVGEGYYEDYAEASRKMAKREPVSGSWSDRTWYREKYDNYCRTLAHMAKFYDE